MKVASKGLERAREIYQDRTSRVRELRQEGKKVIGYLCIYPVTEMLTALDLIPYGIFDGLKVFAWSRKTWAFAFGLSLALTALSYILIS